MRFISSRLLGFATVALSVGACVSDTAVVTPDDLEQARVRHYRITGLDLPTDGTGARAMAFDLDGDGTRDNLLGQAHGFITQQSPAYDVIGAITPRLAGELGWTLSVYDDPATGDVLAAQLARASVAGDAVIPMLDVEPALAVARAPGAQLAGGTARLPLGALSDALGTGDAGWVTAYSMNVLLESVDDTTLTARVGVALRDRDTQDQVLSSLAAYFTARYALDDSTFAPMVDTDGDHVVTVAELAANQIIRALLYPDLPALPSLDEPSVSLGLRITATR